VAAALRFLTAGSVDDGKSTLIGRLLYDSRAILADQLDALHAQAAGSGSAAPDLSLLTDGLEAEREQGITIDVAYRYFATRHRKFIIADAPGHEQYTRNMVTAAAGSDAAVVLVDITKLDLGAAAVALLPQTRRHALLAHLLRVPSIVFAVNKLDAVAHPEAAFAAVRRAIEAFAAAAGITPAGVLPLSALRGDNVVQPWAAPWYHGPSLLQLLEGLPAAADTAQSAAQPLLLPVQYAARPPSGSKHDAKHGPVDQPTVPTVGSGERARTYWGRIAQGRAAVGDEVEVFPSGQRARIVELRHGGLEANELGAGRSAGVVLDRQLDVSRGDWLGTPGTLVPTQRARATLAWLDTEPARTGRSYWVRHAHRWVQAKLLRFENRLDIQTLQPEPAETLQANQIGSVVLQLAQPLPLQPYAASHVGGALIVVDPSSHRTSGALLVTEPSA
jgi:sulfate adenylyltransferase subunit 1